MLSSHLPWQSQRYSQTLLLKNMLDMASTILHSFFLLLLEHSLSFSPKSLCRESFHCQAPGPLVTWDSTESLTWNWHLYAEDPFSCRPCAQICLSFTPLTPFAYLVSSLGWFKSALNLTPKSWPPSAPRHPLMIPGIWEKFKLHLLRI